MAEQRSFWNAVKWSYTGNWGDKLFSAFVTFTLAAILGPQVFGAISIAVIYISFLQIFLDQGLVAALIQRKDLEQEHSDAVFWMDMVLSFVLMALSILLSHWWAAKNHAPEVAKLISVLSICIPIEGLAVVQTALLKKELDFKSLAIRSNISVVAGGLVGIVMALTGFGIWALAGQQIVRDFTALILLWNFSHWRPRLEFSWKHFKDLLGFSVPNFVAQLGSFADGQMSSVVLGLFFGPLAVGLYRLADRLMNSVVVMATSSIQAVSLPEFSRFQHQPEKLRSSALSCIRLTAAVTVPTLTAMAAASNSLMATLGPKWIPAAGVLKVLCVLGMAVVFAYFTGPLMQALSMTRRIAVLEWIRVLLSSALLLGAGVLVQHQAINSQVMGIAWARFIATALLVTPVYVYILMRLCKISIRELISVLMPAFMSSAAILVSVLLIQSWGGLVMGKPLFLLIQEALTGGIVGLVVLLSFDSQLRMALSKLVQRNVSFPAMSGWFE